MWPLVRAGSFNAWTTVPANGSALTLASSDAQSADIELTIALPPGRPTWLTVGALGSDPAKRGSSEVGSGGVRLTLNISAPLPLSARRVTMTLGAEASYTFHHPLTLHRDPTARGGDSAAGDASESAPPADPNVAAPIEVLTVRLLVDKILVEAFVSEGRGVASVPTKQGVAASRAAVWVAGAVSPVSTGTALRATAWEMGCGWTAY